jgi:4,5-dihydroxyphthalate decarboxylase
VSTASVRWRSGGLEEAGREERAEIYLPSDVEWVVIPRDRTLNEMLEQGELDAIISPRPPTAFSRKDKHPHIAQLWPDYPAVELEYFKRTHIFPIMHVVGVRRRLAKDNPWLPVAVMKAFIKAKELIDFRHSTLLPWGAAEYRRMQALLGADYWSYHLGPNRHVLEAFGRYALKQGLIKRKVEPEELFAPSTLNLSKS